MLRNWRGMFEGGGRPLEIYVFTTDTRWANYEAIQADVFDHIMVIVPESGLASTSGRRATTSVPPRRMRTCPGSWRCARWSAAGEG
jgi:hypothetical protein